MRSVLVDNFSSFADNDLHLEPTLDPLLAKNPFFCMGDEWRQMRAQFGPIFSASKVRQSVPLVANVCAKFVQYVDGRLGEQIDAKHVWVVCELVWNGIEHNCRSTAAIHHVDRGIGGLLCVRRRGANVHQSQVRVCV